MAKERKIPMKEVMWADCTHANKDNNCLIPFILNGDNSKFMEINAGHYDQIVRLSDKPLEVEEAQALIRAYYATVTGARKVDILDTLEAVTNYYPIRLREAIFLNGYHELSRKALGARHAFDEKTMEDIAKLSGQLNGVKVKEMPPFTSHETLRRPEPNFVDASEAAGTRVVGITRLMKGEYAMGDEDK